jgi:hypothetical protein
MSFSFISLVFLRVHFISHCDADNLRRLQESKLVHCVTEERMLDENDTGLGTTLSSEEYNRSEDGEFRKDTAGADFFETGTEICQIIVLIWIKLYDPTCIILYSLVTEAHNPRAGGLL